MWLAVPDYRIWPSARADWLTMSPCEVLDCAGQPAFFAERLITPQTLLVFSPTFSPNYPCRTKITTEAEAEVTTHPKVSNSCAQF